MSEEFDLVIFGGQVVTEREVFPATVAVRQGRVAGLLSPGELPPARERIDATGLVVLPGLVDSHVHIRYPGRPEREDAVTGTSAAAAGGITTILEMPISEPTVNSGRVLADRATIFQKGAVVDFSLYGAAGAENTAEVAGLAEAGAVGFKTFLHPAPKGREQEFVGLCCVDDGSMYEVMRAVARTGLRHCFHCENHALQAHLERQLVAAGQKDGPAHAQSRPAVVEDVSVAVLLAMAADLKGPVQASHTSSPFSARLIKEAKARGLDVTLETCPQYLFLTKEMLEKHGPFAKCNPALRSAEEVAGLWEYVLDGTVDMIGSDHAPFLKEEKERAWSNIFSSPAGLPGLEIMLPLALTAVNQDRLSLPKLAELHAERPARIFGLTSKGRIALGYDADLTLVDLKEKWTFDPASSFSKAGQNMVVHQGRALQGRVKTTILRGRKVFDQGRIVAAPGCGRFLRPESQR